jgi:ABC-type multidrug transport system ATPase subunit
MEEKALTPQIVVDQISVKRGIHFSAKNGITRSTILNDISFEIKGFKMVALIGESGSGKSTLLKTLSGVITPTTGKVTYVLNRVEENKYSRTIATYLSQDDMPYSNLSVETLLRLAKKIRVPKNENFEEIQEEILRQTGLFDHRKKSIGKLSGGERRRVNLAIELLTEPMFLFLDEPIKGLDEANQKSILRLIRELVDNEICTVFIATHLAKDHQEFFDQIIQIKEHSANIYSSIADVDETSAENNNVLENSTTSEENLTANQPFSTLLPSGEIVNFWKSKEKISYQFRLQQLSALISRFRRVYLNWGIILFLLLQVCAGAVIINLLARWQEISSEKGFSAALTFAVIVPIIASLLGLVNPHREIVKERLINEHEQRINLKPTNYVLSKLTILYPIVTLQIVAILLLANLVWDYPNLNLRIPNEYNDTRFIEIIFASSLCAIAYVNWGLIISSLSKTVDRATTILTVILSLAITAPILLVEALRQTVIQPAIDILSNLFPSKWNFLSISSTLDLGNTTLIGRNALIQNLPERSTEILVSNWGFLLAHILVSILILWMVLQFQHWQLKPRKVYILFVE